MGNKLSILSIFEKIEDKRQQGKVMHLLIDIIFIAIVATVADMDDWDEIEEYAKLKEGWFRNHIALPNGIPSADTIRRAFQAIDPKVFLQCFMEWTQLISETVKGVGVIAIDGKTMRGTHDSSSGKKALHIVSAWFSETGMVLGQVKTSEKSNEITAIPQLLDILSIRGNIITIDAMGTQKEIAKKIVDKKGDYVLSLKGNQPTLLKEVELFFREVGSEKYREEYGIKHCRQIDNGHGRVECRDYYITDRIGWMDARKEWEKLTTIGMVVYSREEKGEKKKGRRYFICSIKPDVERFAHAVRNHWGIESMHWSLDITFLEDSKRTRKDNGPENLSVLHKFAYNITRNDKGVKKSLKIKRLRASMSEKYLEKLLSGE